MPDENWKRVEEIFLATADLPPTGRGAYLDQACGEDRGLRLEVERMLAADTEGTADMELAIETEAASILDGDHSLLGVELGPYRIIKEIGEGGMSTVFLAERSDDEFHKLVAVKVVKRGMDTSEVLRRFRHERQILAGLEHPYIARLIDGGTTPDGRPFFVMERVEGQPINVYCRTHSLDVESILRLMLRVCEAVSYAHRSLVVHRDLKPGNIFVNRDGVPKLLDFGVAKLLGPEDSSHLTVTALGVGPLTPEYASPEQVRGRAITTATDVYALGAILYELLTGRRAQRIDTLTPQEIDRIVCDTNPPRPSVVVRASGKPIRLDSDLDNIVAMAMRKESDRRYASVEQLARDITRHLEGRPVSARRESFGYRARKFIGRNRLMILAGVLVFGSLLAGVAVSVKAARQAEAARRVAETQRQAAEEQRLSAENQRGMAEHERARAEAESAMTRFQEELAERRLAQMVELANRTLLDVDSAIQKLPGAVDARRQVVGATIQFLENLAKDASRDDRLRLVLSSAYTKVGDIQGYPLRPNLGDSTGALESYRKARALLEPLLRNAPSNPEYILQRLETESNTAMVMTRTGKTEEAARLVSSLLPEARRLISMCPAESRCVLAEAELYSVLVAAASHNDTGASLEYAHHHTESLERAFRALPREVTIQTQLGTAYSEEASALNRRGQWEGAAQLYRQAIEIRQQLLLRNPNDVLLRRSLMITYGNLGGGLGSPFLMSRGDAAGAREYCGKALEIARALASADANDKLAQSDLAQALLYYASLDLPKEEHRAALAMLRESEQILQKLVEGDPQSVARFVRLATVQEYQGRRLQDLGESMAALECFRRSLASVEKLLAVRKTDLSATAQALATEEAIAELLSTQGDHTAALDMARRAVSRAERITFAETDHERVTRYRAMAYGSHAKASAKAGHWADSRVSAERALEEWGRLKVSGSRFLHNAEADKVEALLRESVAHLH